MKIKNASNMAYEKLLDMIFKKEFMQGEKIAETTLVERLNFSRTPIREALAKLEYEGLVEVYPNSYTCIAKYTDEYIKKVGIVRVGLDIMAISLAILNGSNADFEVLENIYLEYLEAIKDDDLQRKIVLDCDFHREISKIGKNEILIKIQEEMYLKVRFIMTYTDFDKTDKMRSARMHEKMLNSLKKRDKEAAIKYVKQHLYDFYNLTGASTNIF